MKSCIVHGCDPHDCGCPDNISQQDYRVYESQMSELPFIAKLAGEKPMVGPITVVWEQRREELPGFPGQLLVNTKAIEARNAYEVRNLR